MPRPSVDACLEEAPPPGVQEIRPPFLDEDFDTLVNPRMKDIVKSQDKTMVALHMKAMEALGPVA